MEITPHYDIARPGITLEIQNRGAGQPNVRVLNTYTDDVKGGEVHPSVSRVEYWPLESSFGWYDFVVEVESDPGFHQRIAGHVETGKHSMSDPAIGR